MKSLEFGLSALVLGLIGFHLVLAPYTKIEERFNLHAIHDILNFGVSSDGLSSYDHKTFPGPVPRTFVGSLAVSAIVSPIVYLAQLFGVNLKNGSQFGLEFLVRLVIGAVNGASLIRFGLSVNKISFKDKRLRRVPLTGVWYLALLASQFHILYYSSRTLPNFIALPLVNVALSQILIGNSMGLMWLAFAGVVFRMEIGIFSVIIAVVSSAFSKRDTLLNLTMIAAGVMFGVIVSLTVDSYFWGYLCIPELFAFKYNVIDGQSVNWGTEPYSAYFFKYVPKIFPFIFLVPSALRYDPTNDGTKPSDTVERPGRKSLTVLSISSLIFIAVMSLQPHKEWRFVIYTVPVFTLQVAANIDYLYRSPKLINSLLFTIVLLLTLVFSVFSVFSGYISSFNYPGGPALTYANEYILKNNAPATIYLDVPARMSGASLFGEVHHANITYDKSEDFDASELSWFKNQYDYVLINLNDEQPSASEWRLVKVFQIYNGVSLKSILDFKSGKLADQVKSLLLNCLTSALSIEFVFIKMLVTSVISKSDYLYFYERVIN